MHAMFWDAVLCMVNAGLINEGPCAMHDGVGAPRAEGCGGSSRRSSGAGSAQGGLWQRHPAHGRALRV